MKLQIQTQQETWEGGGSVNSYNHNKLKHVIIFSL